MSTQRIIHGVAAFYRSFCETYGVPDFHAASSSAVIDMTNELTHALDAVNKHGIASGWKLLDEACHGAINSLKACRTCHPDSLVFLLKFLVYVSTSQDNGAKQKVCEYLAQMSSCLLGDTHPISLLCLALYKNLLLPELCETLFNIIQDPMPPRRGAQEVRVDLRAIRIFYSHILIYQDRYTQADELLIELRDTEPDPCRKVGPLRTLAYSKRRQMDIPAAKEALWSAWRILEAYGSHNTGCGALILEKLAEVSEDTYDMEAAEVHLFQALRIQSQSVSPDVAALRRRVARLDNALLSQGKLTESREVHQEYPGVFL